MKSKVNNEVVLAVERLSKDFGSFRAVDDVSLTVGKGEIFGFLGPNGAGKTTTIKMIAGLLKPDQGRITINGLDLAVMPEQCKQVTGYIPDRPFLYEKLTGMEFLLFISLPSLFGILGNSMNCKEHLVDGLFFRRNSGKRKIRPLRPPLLYPCLCLVLG